jgi:CheY-like chemotaxis protein
MPTEVVRGKRVLVVDDEPLIAGLLSDVLRADGHEVDMVHNGRAALAKIAERAYDLIVSDLRMPDLDGPGLYHELKVHKKELTERIVFVTGNAMEPRNEEFLRSTGVPWVSKPFTVGDIHSLTQRVLRRG